MKWYSFLFLFICNTEKLSELPAANITDELVAFVQPWMDAKITSPCFNEYGTPSCTKVSSVISLSGLRPKPFKHTIQFMQHQSCDKHMITVTRPTTVCSSLTPVSDKYVLPTLEHSLSVGRAATLVVSRTCSSFEDRTFAATGPHVWNSLPLNLRLCGLSHGQFKQLLKTFLFGRQSHGAVWAVF